MTPADVKLPVAPACPFCRSDRIATTTKNVDDAYWRCESCGQVWNPSRLLSFPRR
jgi:transposase-like protein